jgi:hypothetical protein
MTRWRYWLRGVMLCGQIADRTYRAHGFAVRSSPADIYITPQCYILHHIRRRKVTTTTSQQPAGGAEREWGAARRRTHGTHHHWSTGDWRRPLMAAWLVGGWWGLESVLIMDYA